MNRSSQALLTVAILPAWYPTSESPAYGIFVRDQARAASLTDRVVVLAEDPAPRSARGLFSVRVGCEAGLRTFRIRIRRTPPQLAAVGYLLAILAIARRLRREGTPIDLLHAHVHRAGWAAVLVGRLLSVPVVISEHSSEFAAGTLSVAAARRARIAYRMADVVSPVSEVLRKSIEAHGMSANFQVVPNPVDTDAFSLPADRTHDGPVRFAIVALLAPVKGVADALQAFGELARAGIAFHVDVVGDGPERVNCERLARELGIESRIRFRGILDRAGVAATLRNVDALVLSSRAETFGTAVLEGMASGLPVVATRVGVTPELVDEDSGLLVAPGQIGELARALRDMAAQHAGYDRARIAATARATYGLEAVGARWAALYRSVLGATDG